MWTKQNKEPDGSMRDELKKAAEAALDAGREIYQYMEILSVNTGTVVPMFGAYSTDEQGATKGYLGRTAGSRALPGSATAIESIESVGWTLIDAGYVYQQTHAESRDKFFASGQQEAFSGRVIGIYTFRRNVGVNKQ